MVSDLDDLGEYLHRQLRPGYNLRRGFDGLNGNHGLLRLWSQSYTMPLERGVDDWDGWVEGDFHVDKW